MDITIKDIEHLAELSCLSFNEEEKVVLLGEVNNIIDLLDECGQAEVEENIEFQDYVGLEDLREDVPMSTLNLDTVFEKTDKCDKAHFVVPKVVQ